MAAALHCNVAISPVVCRSDSCLLGLVRLDLQGEAFPPVCHSGVTEGSKMIWYHWVLSSITQDTGYRNAVWLMVGPDMNKSLSFLLGQLDGEETSCLPPWPQSDGEEGSHGGSIWERTSPQSQISRQKEGECKVQGRQASEKPWLCMVDRDIDL